MGRNAPKQESGPVCGPGSVQYEGVRLVTLHHVACDIILEGGQGQGLKINYMRDIIWLDDLLGDFLG